MPVCGNFILPVPSLCMGNPEKEGFLKYQEKNPEKSIFGFESMNRTVKREIGVDFSNSTVHWQCPDKRIITVIMQAWQYGKGRFHQIA